MTKKALKTKVARAVRNIGMAAAKNDVNQACACFLYQPKQPKVLKQLKK